MKTSEPQTKVKFIQDKDVNLTSVREVFNNTLEGILIADYKGKLYGCNKTAEQMFGYSAKELGRLHIQQLIAKYLKQDGHLRNDKLFILPDIKTSNTIPGLPVSAKTGLPSPFPYASRILAPSNPFIPYCF